MDATTALAIALSEPSGFTLMFKHDEEMAEMNRAMNALDAEYGKRPSKAREKACERLAMAEGKVLALREALAYMVISASGYTVGRHEAVRAISDEQDALGEACWLAPIGKVMTMNMARKLFFMFNR